MSYLLNLLKPKTSITGAYAPGGFFNPLPRGQNPVKAPNMSMNPLSVGNNFSSMSSAYTSPENTIYDNKGKGIASKMPTFQQPRQSFQEPAQQYDYQSPQNNGQQNTGPSQDDISYALDKIRSLRKYDSPFGVNQFGADALLPTDLSQEELTARAIGLNNNRNDIATGMIDPYKLGVQSGVPFTAQQLEGIERGLGKSIDPALNDYKARILTQEAKSKSASGSWESGAFAGVPNQIRDELMNLQTAFRSEKIVEEFRTLPSSYTFLNRLNPETATNSEIQAALIGFTKSMDPASVVREGELAITTAYATNPDVASQLKNALEKYITTGKVIAPDALRKIISAFNGRYTAMASEVENLRKQYSETAKHLYGTNDELINNILKNYDATTYEQSSQSSKQFQYEYLPDGSIKITSGFSNVGGGTNTAIKNIDDAVARISRNEGNGRYDQLGPTVTSGAYKGQKALGKYQVMPGNVKDWTKEALGYSMTPQQFLSSPQAQEIVVRYRMNKSYKKYGNWSDAASVWFTGGPVAYGKNKKDVLGTTGQQYVDNFNA